jgi:hypothetical protein
MPATTAVRMSSQAWPFFQASPAARVAASVSATWFGPSVASSPNRRKLAPTSAIRAPTATRESVRLGGLGWRPDSILGHRDPACAGRPQKSTESRISGQVMQWPPPRPRPSSAPTMLITSTPCWRNSVLL